MTVAGWIGIKDNNSINISLSINQLNENHLYDELKDQISFKLKKIDEDLNLELQKDKSTDTKKIYYIEGNGLYLGTLIIYKNNSYNKNIYNRDRSYKGKINYRWFKINLAVEHKKFLDAKGLRLPDFRDELAKRFKSHFNFEEKITRIN